ncbi:hypothetical protein [Gloeocapsopsis sp. IPPAS B-1203]|uniref:hypothetical protein n=1 Tax=Gloeocapsopsis sp. IPPAS B-1203 TaxID=2049454 RepID=UPI0025A30F48|nr:hypothetical protein [Gloeocapsopsis sp. IPPAS B-1203]
MPKFPVDAPKAKVVRALELLGFQIVREQEHISMIREQRWLSNSSNTTESRAH